MGTPQQAEVTPNSLSTQSHTNNQEGKHAQLAKMPKSNGTTPAHRRASGRSSDSSCRGGPRNPSGGKPWLSSSVFAGLRALLATHRFWMELSLIMLLSDANL